MRADGLGWILFLLFAGQGFILFVIELVIFAIQGRSVSVVDIALSFVVVIGGSFLAVVGLIAAWYLDLKRSHVAMTHHVELDRWTPTRLLH